MYTRSFTDVAWRTGGADNCDDVSDAVNHGGSGFNLNGVNTRRVEPRNTPTIFNTIFNFRNFWDGRASSVANGGDPFGLRNPDMQLWRVENGVLQALQAWPCHRFARLAGFGPAGQRERDELQGAHAGQNWAPSW